MAAPRVLVVDDEPNVVKSCTRMLQLAGFEAHGVTSGTEAISLYKENRFDLVLVDLKMPDTDGLAVLRALREYDPSASVLIFTAYGTKESVVEALRLGAREFLEKPLDAKRLVDTIQRLLAQGNSAAVRGNLRSMSLPSIIQINCTEQNQARLRVRRGGEEASVFFADGNVVHAEMDSKTGEEVVYELLAWSDGEFELEMGVPAPQRTITTSWSGLLLEGMRRLDEQAAARREEEILPQVEQEKEVKRMAAKKRSERIAEALKELLEGSSDIEGGALVSIDGLVLSANVPIQGLDETLVGAAAAAIFGLSRRSVQQLSRGEFHQTLIQGEEGNIIVTAVDPQNVFVGITPAEINLGMAFYEARQVAQKLAEILKS
ncbi:MAG TPA: response regulator [Thermoflexia bacterium]|jgi:CheY-like chemotaxis protein/predicted regulator of Ras-like GTPase activity (Roadblock/LC7/MglB family)|nr:response regulator [Thermoflexia bacterium]